MGKLASLVQLVRRVRPYSRANYLAVAAISSFFTAFYVKNSTRPIHTTIFLSTVYPI